MFPWLWLWSPQFHYPWSGSVAQNIAPKTRFFDSIPEKAGIGELEQEIFDTRSYGDQLGTIIDALVAYMDVQEGRATDEKTQKKIADLRILKDEVDGIKKRNKELYAQQAQALMKKLFDLDDEAFDATLQAIQAEGKARRRRKRSDAGG